MTFEEFANIPEFEQKRAVVERNLPYWNPHREKQFERNVRIGRTIWMAAAHLQLISPATVSKHVQLTLSPTSTAELALQDFADRVSIHEGIEGVYVLSSEDRYDVWTIIEEFDEDTEDRLAEAELDLMTRFPDFRFDFMLIPRRGRELSDLIPNGGRALYVR
jgi:hypothetical protein